MWGDNLNEYNNRSWRFWRNGGTSKGFIADSIEDNSPVGKTGKLAKVKRKIKNTGLAIEGIANSSAFYDVFQDIGTSQQKKNVGYFDRAVESSVNEAIKVSTEVVFSKVRW